MLRNVESPCVCSDQRDPAPYYSETSSCSPSCDCHSTGSVCQSPVNAESFLSSRDSSDSCARHQEPFYLHPPASSTSHSYETLSPLTTDGLQTNASDENSTGFYTNPLTEANSLEEHKNGINCEQHEPFYLHDPNAVVYNRIRDLFGDASATQYRRLHTDDNFYDTDAGVTTELRKVNSPLPESESASQESASLSDGDDNNNVLCQNVSESSDPQASSILLS